MRNDVHIIDLSRKYAPAALYLSDSDCVEYVRRDVPCVSRRVDELLTLMLDMDNREPIGFRLKGFKNFYLRVLKPAFLFEDKDFLPLVSVIERAVDALADEVFDDSRKAAYKLAHDIASEDNVELRELPVAA